MKHFVLFATFIAILLLASCSSVPSYSGQWAGTANDSVGGLGQANLTVSQSGDQLTGSWQLIFDRGMNSGSLQGTVNGNAVTAQLFPSNPNACPYNVTATRSGDTLTGNYAAFNCSAAIGGTLSVEKQ